jgi:carbamoyl-phosphate synthase large subunit
MAVGQSLPTEGEVFISVRDSDKPSLIETARMLVSMGFTVHTTLGTHQLLSSHSIETSLIRKISEGVRPNILDRLANGEIDLIINTPTRKGGETDEGRIRAMAVRCRVPMITTMTGAWAAVQAITALRAGSWSVAAMQDIFPDLARPETTPRDIPAPWLDPVTSGS